MRKMCAFFTPSTSQKILVQALLKMDEVPVFVIPDLLPRLFLSPPFRPKYSAPIILWVGRLDSHKNWLEFLSMAKDINSINPGIEFWLVGGARSENHEKEKMWATVKKYSLAGQFRWLPSVAYEQMPGLYAFTANSGGCLLSTSKAESFGMVVVEAMACGCPVVAPGISAFKELIRDGVNGCLYRSGDRDMAVERLRSIIDRPIKRFDMIKNAQEFVTREYHPARVMARFLSVLEGLQSK